MALAARSPSARASGPEGSYVARLLDDGPAAAARKVGEEGVEAALAGAGESDERLVEELADLWFHSYVLLAARGLDPSRRRGRAAAARSGGGDDDQPAVAVLDALGKLGLGPREAGRVLVLGDQLERRDVPAADLRERLLAPAGAHLRRGR